MRAALAPRASRGIARVCATSASRRATISRTAASARARCVRKNAPAFRSADSPFTPSNANARWYARSSRVHSRREERSLEKSLLFFETSFTTGVSSFAFLFFEKPRRVLNGTSRVRTSFEVVVASEIVASFEGVSASSNASSASSNASSTSSSASRVARYVSTFRLSKFRSPLTRVAGSGAASGVVSSRTTSPSRNASSSATAFSREASRPGGALGDCFGKLAPSKSPAIGSVSGVSGASVNRIVPAASMLATGNGEDSDDHCARSWDATSWGQRETRVAESVRDSPNRCYPGKIFRERSGRVD